MQKTNRQTDNASYANQSKLNTSKRTTGGYVGIALALVCIVAVIFIVAWMFFDEEPEIVDKNVVEVTADESVEEQAEISAEAYYFRNAKLKNQHYQKHGIEMGFESADDYEAAASAVVNNPDALHKIEAEDGDDVYYLESSNEFVIVSTDGYLRTYFLPNGGKKYFDRQ